MSHLPAEPLTIVIVGASGDLARRKIYPALFALYCQGYLPAGFTVMGYARSPLNLAAFRARIAEHLTCRYVPGAACADRTAEFLDRCFYVHGAYDAADGFLDLYQELQRVEPAGRPNRLFYLAIPPAIFLAVARSLGAAGLVYCGEARPWSRVVIEKPFGHDRASSDALTRELGKVFVERETYRIDHYLGKEVIQNLMVLRFANLVFEPLWNRNHIQGVAITWKENIGVEGRGGYFDDYGIIRDVIQNHLLQMLALVAMEPPANLDSHAVRDAKVAVLRAMPPVGLEDVVLGQYAAATRGGIELPGYTNDPTVPRDSLTPTFAAARLRVDNPRWQGVPFLVSAGKATDTRCTEIRIRFRPVAGGLFAGSAGGPAPNELLIRVQPDEALRLAVTSKVPGLTMDLQTTNLDLSYKAAFNEKLIPDAYECLLLDVIEGEKGLFIRSDELAAAWDVFTPLLHRIEADRIRPEAYPFGSRGPAGLARLAEECGWPAAGA